MRLINAFLATAFAIALACISPAHAQQVGPVYCSQNSFIDVAAGTNRVITAGSSPIIICGMDVSNTAVSTVQIKTGTGANCGTGTVSISPAFSLVAGLSKVGASHFTGLAFVARDLDVCITTTGAANSQVEVYFARQ